MEIDTKRRKEDYDWGYRIAINDSKQGNKRREELKQRIVDHILAYFGMKPSHFIAAEEIAEKVLEEVEKEER